jgi:hypothetical protein
MAMLAATAAGLSGCVTTQEKNARTVLLNERTLATETGVRVADENPEVRVLRVTVIRGRAGDGIAVRMFNSSSRPLTDLPVSIGVRTSKGRVIYLNDAANVDYYDAHVPAIEPGADATWVLTATPLPRGSGRPFAIVGVPTEPPTTRVRTLPRINASAREGAAGHVRVTVTNQSGVPQYGLQVYAVAARGGRDVAVGRATVAILDGGGQSTVSVHLVGTTSGAAIQVYAIPTIFS